MRLIAVMVLSIFLLSGCVSPPTQQDIQSADYGLAVDQEVAETAAKAFFNTRLKDPESARYSFSPLYKGYIPGSRMRGKNLEVGYLLDVNVNAKNSYGGYVGAKPYKFLIRNDQVVQVMEVYPSGMQLPLL